jgi:hypothetical protein
MIAPVSIYGGADTDWGNTSDADRTEIANYLEQAYTKAIGQSMHIVHAPGPHTLLLQMQLVGVESNVPVLSTVSRIYPAGLVLNITKQASSTPGTFSGSVTYALMVYDSTLSTVRAAGAGIDQGATVVGKTMWRPRNQPPRRVHPCMLWQAVDKRGGTTSMAGNTLNTKLDIDHAFQAWSDQLASRLVQSGICGR